MNSYRLFRGVLPAAMTALCISAAAAALAADSKTIVPDLRAAGSQNGWKWINRNVRLIDKDGAPAVRLEGEGGQGIVRLEGVSFANGIIEFDARGRNVVQQSFLGLAFHGADVKTYDAIYFRPFNFKPDDAARRQRAVQYISHPAYTWQKLRTEHPGRYEKPIAPVPDPEGWFHVRVQVAWPKVSVYVNGAPQPCLEVEQLSERKSGWIALWTDVSGGDFANLKITPAP